MLAWPIALGLGAQGVPIAVHAMQPASGGSAGYMDSIAADYMGLLRFPCQSPAAPAPCYGPDQLRAAYNIQPVLDHGITGAGRTVVIISAFQNPTMRADLALFDRAWALPDPTLNIVASDGLTPFDPTSPLQVGWAGEMSIDVEWAHAIAPGATIDLVLAKSEKDADLLSATRYAVAHNLGDIISQSFGEAESCADPALIKKEHALFEAATDKGMTLFASSGDFGPLQKDCNGSLVPAASTPASDPNVTAVGGTTLLADPTSGARISETAWGDRFGAGGGGFSSIYERPGYQASFNKNHESRGLPDVAYAAGAIGSIVVSFGSSPAGPNHFFQVFGTSGGAPQWAAIGALADQLNEHRLGAINKLLYHVGKGEHSEQAFHDITVGNTSFAGAQGFSAVEGWDAATGLGTPNVAKLLPLIT